MNDIINACIKQDRINRKLSFFAFVATVYIIKAEINIKRQREKIKKLNEEIEELKNSKGE